ncbi:FadR/GntR family transcriptional regulator [Ferrimonas senticii]|uniref:FadR/GntR family transcriptional regulator n=1 Tax=Ferrimonas senticii TaxID=394566 RepID=UPI0003F845B5|nr:FadR/GntR family transcriptional regulator [Ferrimonas senticii]
MDERRLYWQIVDGIEQSIEAGDYPAGTRLPPERELAEHYQVSRPTIREAIIALEVRQRVEVKTGSGVYVLPSPTPTIAVNAFELTQARALIEGEIAFLAAGRISDKELQQLAETVAAMQDQQYVEAADERFHQIIAAATGNGAMLQSFNNLWALRSSTAEIIDDYQSVCGSDNHQTIAEHSAILTALQQRDPEQARAAMHRHFHRLLNAMLDQSEAKALAELQRRSSEKRSQYSLETLLPEHLD